mgnify:CR=1 FL=1
MKVETDVEVTETVCHEDKIAHLQMIQGVIDRMSTSAAIYKGFAATIVTGIAAISFTEVSAWILLIAFFPVGCFLVMDTYYLKLEKQYRILYGMKKSLRIFLWIQDAQKQSFMMQTQLGLNACNLQASGCSMRQLLLSG